MKSSRLALAAVALCALSLAPANAQSTNSDAVKRDIATWTASFDRAFAPGLWDTETQELDANGKVVESDRGPDCIKVGETNKMGAELAEAMYSLVAITDCTSSSGGPGSLNLTVNCAAPNGLNFRFQSSGSYSGTQTDWTMKFNSSDNDPASNKTLKLVARRQANAC